MELTDAGNYKPPSASSLADLIEQLHRVFESDHINVEYVHDLMLSYKSNPKEWQKCAKFDRHRYNYSSANQFINFSSNSSTEATSEKTLGGTQEIWWMKATGSSI
uniref:Cysteine dioxygenase n=1 Tax=Ixodes ricinus TaxID=34613 RepID=A0A0K8RJ28_IXORI